MHRRASNGFSLVELSIVLVIVGLMLGGLMVPLSQSIEQNRRSEAKRQLAEISEALLGFAAANGFLPCPATAASNGDEARTGGLGTSCSLEHGFVPARALGLEGPLDPAGRLLDPWNMPFRYSLSSEPAANASAFAGVAPGIAGVWQALPAAELFWICASADCANGDSRIRTIPAVVLSTGFNGAVSTAPDEVENTDGDDVFVSKTYSNVANASFDDLMVWISPHLLYARLVAAGHLP